uniref:Uncharacterized protein n=1 Tax=Mus musculus TaxID=10090 RepID=Q8BLQ2_MOUSE|nr:unnamed protein product [Mus musculus]
MIQVQDAAPPYYKSSTVACICVREPTTQRLEARFPPVSQSPRTSGGHRTCLMCQKEDQVGRGQVPSPTASSDFRLFMTSASPSALPSPSAPFLPLHPTLELLLPLPRPPGETWILKT